MSAAINFYTSNGTSFINSTNGSGLGFFGNSGFGSSIQVNTYQGNTYVCDSTGAIEGPLAENIQYSAINSGIVNNGNTYPLTSIPNVNSTVNIRFTNDTPVQVLSPSLVIYDRSNTNNPPSGLIPQVVEISHPNPTPSTGGSGGATWTQTGGSGGVVNGITFAPPLTFNVPSPGISGLSPNGPDTVDSQHDFYLGISVSPVSIGSKTQFALAFLCEYL